MTLTPKYQNPLYGFVDPSIDTSMSTDGLTIDQVYGVTGVIDLLQQNTSPYNDPTSGQVQGVPQPDVPIINSTPNPNGWVSPSDKGGSPTITEVQFSLQSTTSFNYISFDILNVPCNWTLLYQDVEINPQAFYTLTNNLGVPTQGTITGSQSVVSQLGQGISPSDIEGAFVTLTLPTIAVETNAITLQLDRNVPLNLVSSTFQSTFLSTSYPVGLRNFYIGLIVTNWDSAPPLADPIVSQNPLGFTESYDISLANVEGALVPSGEAITSSYWSCEPQPVADAVVCFYIDVRDEYENPQLIDTLYLEPRQTGPSMNLYSTNDPTISPTFRVSRNAQAFTPVGYGGYVPNSEVNLEMGLDWCMGLMWTPPSNILTYVESFVGYVPLVSFEGNDGNVFQLGITAPEGDLWLLRSDSGVDNGITIPLDNSQTPWYFMMGWNEESGEYTLSASQINNSGVITTISDSFVPVSPYTAVLDSIWYLHNPLFEIDGVGEMSYWWIRQDTYQPTVLNAFVSNPSGFLDAKGPFSVVRGDYKAVLVAQFVAPITINGESVLYWGFMGPWSDYYESKSWTPLQRNLSLTKGFIEFPPQYCSWIKLEFSNLTPEVYTLPISAVQRTINVFPSFVEAYYQNTENNIQDLLTTAYNNLNVSGTAPTTYYTAIPSSNMFGISNIQLGTGYAWPQLYALNASQLNATSWIYPGQVSQVVDPTSSILLLQQTSDGSQYTPSSSNQAKFLDRSFVTTGVHTYNQVNLTQTWNQSYFVGLNAVYTYKSNPSSGYGSTTRDTVDYLETCVGDGPGTLIDTPSSSMELVPGLGYIAGGIGEDLVTYNLQSYSEVQRVQLAGVTSTWVSPLSDSQLLLNGFPGSSFQLENSIAVSAPTSFGVSNTVQEIFPSIITSSQVNGNARIGGYWPLTDEGGSHIAEDGWMGNNMSSVTSGTGTVTFGETTFYPEEDQVCVVFSGSSPSNEAYLITENEYIPGLSGSVFVAFEETSSTEGYVAGLNEGSNSDKILYIDSAGGLNFGVYDIKAGEFVTVTDDSTNYGSGIYRVSATWSNLDSINLTLQLTVNGVLKQTVTGTHTVDTTTAYFLRLGEGPFQAGVGIINPPSDTQFQGAMAEVSLLEFAATSSNFVNEQAQIDYPLPNGAVVPFGNYGVETVASNLPNENLLTPDDANVPNTLGGWQAISNAVVSRVAIHGSPAGSTHSVQVTTITSGPDTVAGLETGIGAYLLIGSPVQWDPEIGALPLGAEDIGGELPVSPSTQQYTWMVSVLGSVTASRTYELYVMYYDQFGNLLNGPNGTLVDTVTETQDSVYTQLIGVVTAPAGATYTSIQVHGVGLGTGESYYIAMAGLYLGVVTEWSPPVNYVNMRASAVARVYLPETANGTYEVRLKSNGQIVAKETTSLPLKAWTDIEVPYLTKSGDGNFQAEVVQIGPYEEPFYLDMLGFFLHPVRWEISPDGGTTWRTVEKVINEPWGFVTLETPTTELMLRLTALTSTVKIGGFMIRPIYLQSPFSYQVSLNYLQDLGSGELESKRPPKDKSFFKLWSHLYPERLSLAQLQLQAGNS